MAPWEEPLNLINALRGRWRGLGSRPLDSAYFTVVSNAIGFVLFF
jgi:hypothetical protein